jgi:hypothetical protein
MGLDETIYDDPIWEYTVVSRLQPYLPAVRKWWSNYENMKILTTGVCPIQYDDIEVPPGLAMRMTSTPVRSPIKNVQAFPFVPSAYLQITGVPGGVNRMIERVCYNGLKLEEFTIIEKHNLPSAYQKGQLICFVPTTVLEGAREMGKYVYLTLQELCALAKGEVLSSIPGKCAKYLGV